MKVTVLCEYIVTVYKPNWAIPVHQFTVFTTQYSEIEPKLRSLLPEYTPGWWFSVEVKGEVLLDQKSNK